MFLWQLWRLRQGIVSGRRRFAPLSNESRLLRLAQGAVAVVLALGLFWASNQDYLFVSAVFPIASSWLGISLLALAVGLLLSALFPYLEAS
jgi:hypothetical protein